MNRIDKLIFAVGLCGYAGVVAGAWLLSPGCGLLLGGTLALLWSAWQARAEAIRRAQTGTD